MNVRNLTPFPWGRLVASRRPPSLEMVVVVRGTFDVVPGGACVVAAGGPEVQGVVGGESLADADDPAVAAPLAPNDLVPFKTNAEVLVVGSCTTAGGRPVTEMPVEVRVGTWSKGLSVVGRRAYSDGGGGALASRPLPFTSMPLHYGVAYGGPGYPQNPAGAGIASAEAPNLEHPGETLGTRGGRPARGPAALGATNVRWPSRTALLGTSYGGAWRKSRAPWLGEDFDWRFFHEAAPDQQLPGYLRGDEALSLTNLHPTLPRVTSRLPGVRPRVLVRLAGGVVRDVPLQLDTLVVVADQGRIRLTWRGLVDVTDDELEDVEAVLLDVEPLGAPRPAAEVHAELEKAQAPGTPDPAVEAQRAEAAARLARIEAAGAAARRGDEPPADALTNQLVAPLPPDDPATIQARADIRAALAAHDEHVPPEKSQLKAMVPPAGSGPSPSPIRDLAPGEAPQLPPSRKLARGIEDAIAEARKAEPELERDPRGRAAEEAREVVSRLEALKVDPRFRPVFKPRVEPGPARDLSDQDLEGEDLRRANLEGANLEATILTRANLESANLRGANLRSAVLFRAVLDGADLEGASLSLTNLVEATGRGASFRGVTIDRVFFEKARLVEASFTGARGLGGFFDGTDLERAELDRLLLERSRFAEARLVGASFRGARLTRVAFDRCKLAGARFDDAQLDGTSLLACEAQRAVFARAAGKGASFQGSILDGADFSLAVLPGAMFPGVSLVEANLHGADLRNARLGRARLDRASFENANLLEADLRKASCAGVSFRKASLHAANLLGAAGKGADFGGANLTRCQIEGVS